MTIYLNAQFDDGENLAVEVATNQGWSDFAKWASGVDSPLVHDLANGHTEGSEALEAELQGQSPSSHSVREVLARLVEVMPHEGDITISQEPLEADEEEA